MRSLKRRRWSAPSLAVLGSSIGLLAVVDVRQWGAAIVVAASAAWWVIDVRAARMERKVEQEDSSRVAAG